MAITTSNDIERSVVPRLMGACRIVIGILITVAPERSLRAAGLPAHHDTHAARLAGRLFGVRDIVLGAQVLACREDQLASLLPFNAAVEAGDFVSLLAARSGGRELGRAGLVGSFVAAAGFFMWIRAWLAIRRDID